MGEEEGRAELNSRRGRRVRGAVRSLVVLRMDGAVKTVRESGRRAEPVAMAL